MELSTLVIKVDAQGAIHDVKRLTTELDRNVVVAKKVEVATGGASRQMGTAAQKSLLLADALARGSVSGATLSARLLGLSQTMGLVFGPTGIAVAAVAGFVSMYTSKMEAVRKASDETRKKLLEDFTSIANAADPSSALAKMAVLDRGTRAGNWQDGIQGMQAKLESLGGLVAATQKLNEAEALAKSGVAGAAADAEAWKQRVADIKATQRAIAPLVAEFEQLEHLVLNWTRSPATGPLSAVTINASREAVVNLTGAILDARAAWEGNILNRNRGVAKSVPGQPSTGDPLAPIGIGGGISPHPFWRGIGKGDGAQADAFTEAFAENFSRAMGDAIGRAFTGQLSSGREFAGAISNVIGQAIAGRVSKGIADQLSGVGTLGLGVIGGGIGILASAIDGLFGASQQLREAAKELKASVAQSKQDVARWGARAGASPEQQALFGTQDTAAGFFRDLVDQLVQNPEFGTVFEAKQILSQAHGQFGEFDFDEIRDVWALFKDISSTEDQARLQEILNTYQSVIAAQERSAALSAANTLGDYRKSLTLSQFSPLSPTAQLKEARAEFERLRGLAMGGDTTAANQLVGASQTLLGLSRQVNASGGRYVADFNSQKDTFRIVEEAMRAKANADEQVATLVPRIANSAAQTVEKLTDSIVKLDAILTKTGDLIALTEAGNVTRGAGFTAVVAEQVETSAQVFELTKAVKELVARRT
jgi:hypothetical protein